jgi:hypothetical protein
VPDVDHIWLDDGIADKAGFQCDALANLAQPEKFADRHGRLSLRLRCFGNALHVPHVGPAAAT